MDVRSASPIFFCVIAALSGCASGVTRHAPIEARAPDAPEVSVDKSTPPANPTRAARTETAPHVFTLPAPDAPTLTPIPAPDAVPLGDEEASDRAFQAPQTDAEDPASRVLLADAEASLQRGDKGAARAILERALKINSDQPGLWLRLAEINLAEGEVEQAVVLAERARALAGSDPIIAQRAVALIRRASESHNPAGGMRTR